MIRQDTRHIMIVDDDPVDTELLCRMIENIRDDYRYQIHTAENADQAIGLYATRPIDCAFIDYDMPRINGLDLISMFNSLPSHVSLRGTFPVIVISSHMDQDLVNRSKEVDAFGFAPKRDMSTSEDVRALIDQMLTPYEVEKQYIA